MIQKTLRFLPIGLRSKIEHRHSLIDILDNIIWLFSDKFLRMGVGVIVGVWLARYLGPEQFGILSFAIAFVALFDTFASLGLGGFVVRDLVKNAASTHEILGTAFILRVIGGFFAFLLAVGTISYLRPEDMLAKAMVGTLSFALILKASEVVKYWFESQVLSKYTVWIESTAYLIIATIKIVMILLKATLMAFVIAMFIEAALVATGLLVAYMWREGSLLGWRPSLTKGIDLLRHSWPLLISSGFVLINMNVDKVMLGEMAGQKEIGFYSAATTLSAIWYFVPVVVGASVAPMLTILHQKDKNHYVNKYCKIFNVMTLSAVCVALPMTVMSEKVIVLIFGVSYIDAGVMLLIHIWAAVFIFHVSIRTRLYVIEGIQKFVPIIAGLTVASNVMANIILIPIAGGVGAAYASLLSWGLCVLVFPLLFRKTRNHSVIFIQSFIFKRPLKKC